MLLCPQWAHANMWLELHRLAAKLCALSATRHASFLLANNACCARAKQTALHGIKPTLNACERAQLKPHPHPVTPTPCQVEALEALLEAGASVGEGDNDGDTPLHELVRGWEEDKAEQFLATARWAEEAWHGAAGQSCGARTILLTKLLTRG
jgi:hypothetical protein